MRFWNYFWIANMILAGSSFAIITLVVMVRGPGELWATLKGLHAKEDPGEAADSQ